MKLAFVWAAAALFLANALYAAVKMKRNFGTAMLWIIFILLVLYGIFHRHVDVFLAKGIGMILKYAFFAGLAFFAGMFIFVAVSGYADSIDGSERAYIVLGAGLDGESPNDVLRRRLDAAIDAHGQNPDALIVVSGGKGDDEQITEALAMQRYLLANGVPADKVFMEEKSTSTDENLRFSRELLAEQGITVDDSIGVITNAFHCYRAGQFAEQAGFSDIRFKPASISLMTVLPVYIREVFAILYFRVSRLF